MTGKNYYESVLDRMWDEVMKYQPTDSRLIADSVVGEVLFGGSSVSVDPATGEYSTFRDMNRRYFGIARRASIIRKIADKNTTLGNIAAFVLGE